MSKKWTGKLVRFKSDPTFRVHRAYTISDGSVNLLVTNDNSSHRISVNSNLMKIVGTYPAVNQVWENKRAGDRVIISDVQGESVEVSARKARVTITMRSLFEQFVMVLDA